MQISSRLTVAVHVLLCIEVFKDQRKVTSDFLASSVNVNPVVIRRILQQLKRAGIVRVTRGSGGADTARPLKEITLLDLYHAVECVDGEACSTFMRTPTVSARWGGIFTPYWMGGWRRSKRQWSGR